MPEAAVHPKLRDLPEDFVPPPIAAREKSAPPIPPPPRVLEQLEPLRDELEEPPRVLEQLEASEANINRSEQVQANARDSANQIRARLGRPPLPDSLADATPQERVAARGKQRAQARAKRMGRVAPPRQPQNAETESPVDIAGPPPKRDAVQRGQAEVPTLTGPPPEPGQQPAAPAAPAPGQAATPPAPQQGDTAGTLKSILEELKRQSGILAKIAEKNSEPVVS